MRKTLIYFVLLAVLGLGVYYFLFNNKENIYASNEAGFTIKDTSSIGRIYVSAHNSSILVERTDTGWMVNKKYKALHGMLSVLFKTLSKQEALYPVPKSLHNVVIKDLAGTGIKIEIDDREGKKMRVFYVGGEQLNSAGTYMLMEGASKPYVVQVRGFQGSIAPSYSSNIDDWRDRTVFNLKPQDIQSVSMQYPEHPLNSFTINQNSGKVAVVVDPQIAKYGKLNERRAHVFLKFFENVSCEGYINGASGLDSILRSVPVHCIVDLVGTKGQNQHLTIYWMQLNRRSKNMTAPDPKVPENKFDADHFYAVMNGGHDTVMIQAYVFNKIFRNAYEFYQPDPTEEELQQQQLMRQPEERKKAPPGPLLPNSTKH